MTMFILAICAGMCQIDIKGTEDWERIILILIFNTQSPIPNPKSPIPNTESGS